MRLTNDNTVPVSRRRREAATGMLRPIKEEDQTALMGETRYRG